MIQFCAILKIFLEIRIMKEINAILYNLKNVGIDL